MNVQTKMKRYRIIRYDFDTRVGILKSYNKEKDNLNNEQRADLNNIILGLKLQYGEQNFENKLHNLFDIGSKKMSIIAFHNKFLQQIRDAFIMGAYYPALTSSCTLGERILNHLILNLREQFRNT